MISTQKEQALERRMAELGLREEDLVEKFILGTGSGGQKINKTSSCVYLKHIPTGEEIKCQRERSRAMNRFLARTELCDRIEQAAIERKQQRRQAAEKKRRRHRRPSKAARKRNVESKRKRGEIKKLRKPPRSGLE